MEHSLWNTGVAQGFLFLTSNCGLCVTEYIVFLWKESVEGASESLIFSSLINVLSNPASDCPAYGQLFFAELFIFTSEGAGTESQSSLPCSLTPLCWKQEPGYYLRVAVALLSQPGTVNFAQTHGGWGGVGECTCNQIPYSLHLKEKSLSDTSPFLYCLITSWDAWERILVLIHFARYSCAGLSIKPHSKGGFPVQKRMEEWWGGCQSGWESEARLLGAAEKSDSAGKRTKIESADCEHGVREYLKGTNPKERGGN